MKTLLTGMLMVLGLIPQAVERPPEIASEDLVSGIVSYGGRPVAGAVVYLEQWTNNAGEPEAPSEPASADTVVLDQRGLRFLPGTMVVRPGTTVLFLNNDDIQHNVFSPGRIVGTGDPFDLGTYARGETRYHTFGDTGPHTILCNVHPEMVAYIVSVPGDYKTVTDPDGHFALPDVPNGPYLLRVWHPQADAFDMAVQVESRLRSLNITLESGG